MRSFKCYTCEHTWQLPHGEGGRGVDLVCPKCGSKNIHRENSPRGRGWRQQESSNASTKDQEE